MKKIIATLALLSLFMVPVMTLAAEQTQIPSTSLDDPGTLIDKIEDIGNWVFTGLLIIAAIFMVVAGYMFVTGGGDPERIKKARETLINALIGVAVAVASKGLVAIIRNIIET